MPFLLYSYHNNRLYPVGTICVYVHVNLVLNWTSWSYDMIWLHLHDMYMTPVPPSYVPWSRDCSWMWWPWIRYCDARVGCFSCRFNDMKAEQIPGPRTERNKADFCWRESSCFLINCSWSIYKYYIFTVCVSFVRRALFGKLLAAISVIQYALVMSVAFQHETRHVFSWES